VITLLRQPTREYRTPTMDSRRWDSFSPRPGDVVLATYPKSGTVWTQRIVDMLIHQSSEPRPIGVDAYPWLDATFLSSVEATLAVLEAQARRRAIKTHLPFDGLPVYQEMKYVHVTRAGLDACLSMHNHQIGYTEPHKTRIAETQGRAAAPEDPREYYLQWVAEIEAGGSGSNQPLSLFDHEMTFWRERTRPNLLMVHYNDLKADLSGEIRRISSFLEIDTPDDLLNEFAQAARFENMKADGKALLPGVQAMFDRGHERFLNKGTNERWRGVLNPNDLARYAALVTKKLTPAAAAWIERGRLCAGDPRTIPEEHPARPS
jgi:aryl sulfotransferase